MKSLKNKYISIGMTMILLAMSSSIQSCQQDEINPDDRGYSIKMTLVSPGMVSKEAVTKSPGIDALNENLITSFYYYFFPLDVTDQSATVKGYVAGIHETDSYQVTIPTNSNAVNNILFASSRNCSLFVVANPPEEILSSLKGNPTLAQLRALTLVTSELEEHRKLDSFVMVYDGTATLQSRSEEIALEQDIELKRLAIKVSMEALVDPSFTDAVTGITWYSLPGDMTLAYGNGFKKANLAGDFKSLTGDLSPYYYKETADLDAAQKGLPTASIPTEDGMYHISWNDPIYTYPMVWEFATPTEPYFIYDLPWQYTDGGGNTHIQHSYYRIVFGQKAIFSNEWYKIKVRFTVLGSLFRESPTSLYQNLDYLVQPWGQAFDKEDANDTNVNAIVSDARYLSVPTKEYTIHNQNSVSIPFTSSHACEIVDFSVKTTNIKQAGIITRFALDITSSQNREDWVNIVGNKVVFNHTLHNDFTKTNVDVTPYKVTFTLRHADNHSNPQTVTVYQYPGIYITPEINSKYAENPATDQTGYVFVNPIFNYGSGTFTNNGASLGGVLGIGTSGNVNPNMFIIHVSTLPDGSDFTITDPRSNDIIHYSWSAPITPQQGKDIKTGEIRNIQYYYPTQTTEESQRYIAPVIRMASSYGKVNQKQTRDVAQKRCATYQEDGYPAGRWRLPTKAEAEFLISLSASGKIAILFNNDEPYWCATGRITPSSYAGKTYDYDESSEIAFVRCVYDDWYWDNVDPTYRKADKNIYTLGDMAR